MSISERYKIVERLGKQKIRKFGDTFLVQEKAGDRFFVMKVVSTSDKTAAARLRNEANFDFDIPGLPTIVEFYESESELILIKNHVEGVDLDTKWGQFKKKERHTFTIDFITKLVPLFNELTKNEIVHADIKPSNFIISDNRDSFDVHLIDFGLSIRKNDLEDRSILFPLGFAAPELLFNELSIVDQRTDIYALGILLWRLWTGKLPLTHPNPSIFTNLQLTHPLPDHSDLPKGYYPIIQKMTHKHQFSIPPNKMNKEDVRSLLEQAMSNRYLNLETVEKQLREIPVKKSFYQRISLR